MFKVRRKHILQRQQVYQGFINQGISTSPTIVQTQKVNLTFYATPETNIVYTSQGKSFIRLTVPDKIILYQSGVTCFDLINKTNCTVLPGPNSFTIYPTKTLLAQTQFQYSLTAAINNPDSEQPTGSFKLETSSGEQVTQGLSIKATRGSMKFLSFKSLSQVVGDSTNLQVRFRADHSIPKSGFLLLSFPKWNPNSLLSQKSYIQGSQVCSPISVLTNSISCSFAQDQLVVAGVAPSQQQSSGIELAFQVSGFKNPIDASEVKGFKLQTAIQSSDGTFFIIDEAISSLKVSDYASLSQAKLYVKDPTIPGSGVIQSVDQMILDFFLPVPLNSGCVVKVTLPDQYSINLIKQVWTQQAFGPFTNYTPQSDNPLVLNITENSFTINPCSTYIENNMIARIEIDSLKQYNYEGPTDSLQIQINNYQGSNIAQIESGVTFTPSRGNMTIQATAENPTVQEKTMITFTFIPQNAVFIQDDPMMIIEFPSEIEISSVQCIVQDIKVNGLIVSAPVQCTRFQQILTIKKFFIADYFPDQGNSMQFTIGQVTNPISVMKFSELKITLMAQKIDGQFAIDEYQGDLPYQVQKGRFQQTQIISSSYVAYAQDVTYTIKFSPDHIIPQNGYIDIFIPSEISIPDKSYTQSSCRAVSGFPTTMITCRFLNSQQTNTQLTSNYYAIRILQAFRTYPGPGMVNYVLTLAGLKNSMSIKDSNSFQFYSYSSDNKPIDAALNGSSIKMQQSANLQTVQVVLGSYDNSAHTNYTFTLVPSTPIDQSNFILVSFPSQIKLPSDSSTFNCTSTFTALFNVLNCSYDPQTPANTVRVDFTFVSQVQGISPLDRFAFTIQNIQNPPTLRPTDSIQINVVNSEYTPINSMTQGIVVTTNNPSIIKQANIVPSNINPGRATNFTINFFAEHTIQPEGGILLVYPPQITHQNQTQQLSVTFQIQGQVIDQQKLSFLQNESARAILVWSVIQGNTPYVPQADQPIQITISGLKNPYTNAQTDSFSVTTFDTQLEQGQLVYYYIDKKGTDLAIRSKCNYPCKDCNQNAPDICTECQKDSGLEFLQLGDCVKQCASSRYFNKKLNFCDECDPTCLQCDGTSTTCTKCGIGSYLYLNTDNNTCVQQCPDGKLNDSNRNLCIPCNENCKTCENKIDSCTSCDADKEWPYFFHNNCLSVCEPQISVLVDAQCVECNSSCKTCSGTPTSCTSCEPYLKYEASKGTCSQMCEPDTQIFIPNAIDPTQSGHCEFCNPTCLKCTGTVNTCTLCQPGYVLNMDQTCKSTCNNSDGTQAFDQTAISGVCYKCAEPCASCQNTINTCSSCLNDYLIYQGSKCVQYCPEKWIPNKANNTCIFEGLTCPDDFKINKLGDGCIPKAFDCKKGYTINENKTACVPKPGSPVPFPFILSAIFLSFLVLGSFIKDKFFTKVISNLITLIGALEIVMYVNMIIFAYIQTQWLIMFLVIAGLIGLFTSNIIFVCWYRHQILNVDEIFKKWLHFFPNTSRSISVFCLLINFKICKMLYSGFYGLESATAKFGNSQNFFRVMSVTTYFSWIFCYLPIYAADIIVFLKVKWGYQLLILAIETAILQTLSIVLTCIEFKDGYEKLLKPVGEHYAQLKKGKEMRVMGVDEEDDYEQGIPVLDEKTLLRSKLKTEKFETELRRKAFSKILNQVGVSFGSEKVKVSDFQSDLQACMSKFDLKNLKYRRAFSLSDINEKESWIAEGDSDQEETLVEQTQFDEQVNGDVIRRRYSYPLSPRTLAEIPDKQLFQRQIEDIKVASEDFLINNVYTDIATTEPTKPKIKVKTVSRRTQTFLRELLQVDAEEINDSEMEVVMEEEAEIQPDYAFGLINNVIDGISNQSEDKPPVVEEKIPKLAKKRIFKAKKEIPDFELTDIMGEFEIDDLGNFVIMRGENGELLDKLERLVNRRGYLIDKFGNVINLQGDIIFKAVELDIDDEIPAPFGFEKRKKNILRLGEDNKFTIENLPEPTTEIEKNVEVIDEENLEKELQKIREQSLVAEEATIRAEVRPGNLKIEDLDNSGSFKFEEETQEVQESNFSQLNENEQDIDHVIDKVTKKKIPRKKDKLKGVKAPKKKNKLDNLPPKRIKPTDMSEMFPTIGIESEEQRRLAKIAGAIGSLASQLAQNIRQESVAQQKSQQDRNNYNSFYDNEKFDPQQLERIKREQYNQIVNESEIGIDFNAKHQRSMLHERPGTKSNQSFIQVSAGQRKNTSMERAATAQGSKLGQGGRQKSMGQTRESNLQKVYGNIVDLVGFEEQNMVESRGKGSPDHQRRIGSGKNVQSGDLENIYLKNNKQKQYKGTQRSDPNPFRPTLNKFADDPAELNIDTTMQGENYGRDISLVIAENLDKMQRDYLTGVHGQQLTQHAQTQSMGPNFRQVGQTAFHSMRQPGSELSNQHSEFQFSGQQQIGGLQPTPPQIATMTRGHSLGGTQIHSRLAGAQSHKNSNLDPIRLGNWMERENQY